MFHVRFLPIYTPLGLWGSPSLFPGGVLRQNRNPPVLHGGGKDDLGLGVAVFLQLADKGVQLHRAAEGHLDQHGILPGDAVALQHVGAGLDKGVKAGLLGGVHLQIDKGGDMVPQLQRIHHRRVPLNDPLLFQPVDPGAHRRGRKKNLLGQML